MKAEKENRTKQIIAIVLGIIAIATVTRSILSRSGAPAPARAATVAAKGMAAAGESLDPRLRLDLLANSEAVQYEGTGKNIFRATDDVVIPPVKVSPLLRKQQAAEAAAKAAQAALPPPPPPINLKFFGFSSRQGEQPEVFLAQGGEVWIAREGDVVNRQYKIVHVAPNAVEVEDLLNNNRQSIPLTQG